MTTTTNRLLAGASAAAITGTVLAVSPIAASSAEAMTARIKVNKVKKADQLRAHVINVARRQVGERYSTGSTGPAAFDCSGLVVYSYRKATGRTLPRTSYSQRATVRRVDARHRKIGDLVFFNGSGHVALYIGHNRIVHASNPSRGVRIDRVSGWYRSTLVGYGRVIAKR